MAEPIDPPLLTFGNRLSPDVGSDALRRPPSRIEVSSRNWKVPVRPVRSCTWPSPASDASALVSVAMVPVKFRPELTDERVAEPHTGSPGGAAGLGEVPVAWDGAGDGGVVVGGNGGFAGAG